MRYPGPLCARAVAITCGWALGCLAWADANDATAPAAEPRPAARAAALMILRESHRYDASIRQRYLAERAALEDVVEMEPVVVTESKAERQFTRYAELQRRRLAASRPGFTNGGDIPGVPGLSIKPHADLFADDARFNSGKVDVFRFALYTMNW